MIFLKFIFYLGVIYILFDLLWTLFVWGLKNLLGIDKSEGVLYYLTKGLSLYILVALTAITTLQFQTEVVLQWKQSGFAIIGLIVLYLYISSRMQRSRLKAKIRMDVATVKRMRYDGYFLLGALVFFIISLYIPRLNDTALTGWIFDLINKVYSWLLVRWVVGFLAIFFLINILIRSFIGTRLLLYSIFGIPNQPRSRFARTLLDEKQHGGPETVDADFEVIDEEGDREEGSRP